MSKLLKFFIFLSLCIACDPPAVQEAKIVDTTPTESTSQKGKMIYVMEYFEWDILKKETNFWMEKEKETRILFSSLIEKKITNQEAEQVLKKLDISSKAELDSLNNSLDELQKMYGNIHPNLQNCNPPCPKLPAGGKNCENGGCLELNRWDKYIWPMTERNPRLFISTMDGKPIAKTGTIKNLGNDLQGSTLIFSNASVRGADFSGPAKMTFTNGRGVKLEANITIEMPNR